MQDYNAAADIKEMERKNLTECLVFFLGNMTVYLCKEAGYGTVRELLCATIS